MRLRRWIRPLVDELAMRSGLLSAAERRMRRGLTILTYHRVMPEGARDACRIPLLVVSDNAFAQQVAWLAAHCSILPLCEAWARMDHPPSRGGAPARPLVALTFDDGYRDSREVVAPILERHGVRGTFFVTPGVVEEGRPYWFEEAAHLWSGTSPDARRRALETGGGRGTIAGEPVSLHEWLEALKAVRTSTREQILTVLRPEAPACPGDGAGPLMSPDEIIDLDRRGHEIGSHSMTHPILTGLGDLELRGELRESRRRLEDWLGAPVPGFCYPNGDADQRVRRETEAAGYDYACTTAPGLNLASLDRYALRRRDVTMPRVADRRGRYETRSFRAELCGLREGLRAVAGG